MKEMRTTPSLSSNTSIGDRRSYCSYSDCPSSLMTIVPPPQLPSRNVTYTTIDSNAIYDCIECGNNDSIEQRKEKLLLQEQLECLEYLEREILSKPSTQQFLDDFLENEKQQQQQQKPTSLPSHSTSGNQHDHDSQQPPNSNTESGSLNPKRESVRMIQANRYEIFVFLDDDQQPLSSPSSPTSSTDCIDVLLQRHGLDPTIMKRSLISYARTQAKKAQAIRRQQTKQEFRKYCCGIATDCSRTQSTPFPPHTNNRATKEVTNTAAFGPNFTNECCCAHSDDAAADDYKFGNFSLIVTYGAVEAQAPHIDLLYPNYQYGVILTPNSPGTVWYTPRYGPVQTIPQLLEAWERANSKYDARYYVRKNGEKFCPDGGDEYFPHPLPPGVPKSLIRALYQSQDAQTLIRGFGNVLVPEEELQHHEAKIVKHGCNSKSSNSTPSATSSATPLSLSSLPAGTLLSLPGSVVHAGPTCSHFRAVLFFSAWPTLRTQQRMYHHGCLCQQRIPANDYQRSSSSSPPLSNSYNQSDLVAEYHPDTQYSAVLLCAKLTQILWRQVGMDYEARRFLLYQLHRYIRQGGDAVTPFDQRSIRNYAWHFAAPWDEFTTLIAQMEHPTTSTSEFDSSDEQTAYKHTNEKITTWKRQQRDWKIIHKAAQNESLCFYNVLGTRTSQVHNNLDSQLPPPMLKGDFLQISVPRLHVAWQEEEEESTEEEEENEWQEEGVKDEHGGGEEEENEWQNEENEVARCGYLAKRKYNNVTREESVCRRKKVKYYPVQIFERPLDGKVLIFYPQEADSARVTNAHSTRTTTSTINNTPDAEFSWEGAEPGKHYRLRRTSIPVSSLSSSSLSQTFKIRREMGEYWFDGTNATLLDSDGDPIQCMVRPPYQLYNESQARKQYQQQPGNRQGQEVIDASYFFVCTKDDAVTTDDQFYNKTVSSAPTTFNSRRSFISEEESNGLSATVNRKDCQKKNIIMIRNRKSPKSHNQMHYNRNPPIEGKGARELPQVTTTANNMCNGAMEQRTKQSQKRKSEVIASCVGRNYRTDEKRRKYPSDATSDTKTYLEPPRQPLRIIIRLNSNATKNKPSLQSAGIKAEEQDSGCNWNDKFEILPGKQINSAEPNGELCIFRLEDDCGSPHCSRDDDQSVLDDGSTRSGSNRCKGEEEESENENYSSDEGTTQNCDDSISGSSPRYLSSRYSSASLSSTSSPSSIL